MWAEKINLYPFLSVDYCGDDGNACDGDESGCDSDGGNSVGGDSGNTGRAAASTQFIL